MEKKRFNFKLLKKGKMLPSMGVFVNVFKQIEKHLNLNAKNKTVWNSCNV